MTDEKIDAITRAALQRWADAAKDDYKARIMRLAVARMDAGQTGQTGGKGQDK